MSRPRRDLADAVRIRQLIRIDRSPVDMLPIDGFALGISRRFLLVQHVESTIQLNGYMVLRLEDIAGWGDHPFADFMHQALRIRREIPRWLDHVPLNSYAAMFQAVGAEFPLVAIHTELVDPSRCWIGRVERTTRQVLTLKKLSPSAQWIESEKFHFRDITKVDFGGYYERALWEVVTNRPDGAPILPIKVNGKVAIEPNLEP
ncbi:MAG: hypothetical protein U0800_10095 [Isosphaeraceae bacterium]